MKRNNGNNNRKNNRKAIWMIGLLCLFYSMNGVLYAQYEQADTLLIRINDEKRYKRKFFNFHTVVHGGFILPPKDNTHYRMRYGNSVQGLLGFQLNFRPARCYQMGLLLSATGNLYDIRQDNTKWFIDQIQYRKEVFRTGELSLAYLHQFKLNRGSAPKIIIEVSAYGTYLYSASRKTVDISYPGIGCLGNGYSEKIKQVLVERKLSYVEHWLWGFRAKLSYKGIGIYAEYRMNNLLKLGRQEDYKLFDLPALSVGITLSGKLIEF